LPGWCFDAFIELNTNDNLSIRFDFVSSVIESQLSSCGWISADAADDAGGWFSIRESNQPGLRAEGGKLRQLRSPETDDRRAAVRSLTIQTPTNPCAADFNRSGQDGLGYRDCKLLKQRQRSKAIVAGTRESIQLVTSDHACAVSPQEIIAAKAAVIGELQRKPASQPAQALPQFAACFLPLTLEIPMSTAVEYDPQTGLRPISDSLDDVILAVSLCERLGGVPAHPHDASSAINLAFEIMLQVIDTAGSDRLGRHLTPENITRLEWMLARAKSAKR
jgi:hypothetical protein